MAIHPVDEFQVPAIARVSNPFRGDVKIGERELCIAPDRHNRPWPKSFKQPKEKRSAGLAFGSGVTSVGQRIAAFVGMEREDVPKENRAVEISQHPPDDGGGPLGDRRPPCCAGERQRSEEFTMVRKVDIVGQCETGATTASVAKIASNPK